MNKAIQNHILHTEKLFVKLIYSNGIDITGA